VFGELATTLQQGSAAEPPPVSAAASAPTAPSALTPVPLTRGPSTAGPALAAATAAPPPAVGAASTAASAPLPLSTRSAPSRPPPPLSAVLRDALRYVADIAHSVTSLMRVYPPAAAMLTDADALPAAARLYDAIAMAVEAAATSAEGRRAPGAGPAAASAKAATPVAAEEAPEGDISAAGIAAVANGVLELLAQMAVTGLRAGLVEPMAAVCAHLSVLRRRGGEGRGGEGRHVCAALCGGHKRCDREHS